MAEKPLAPSTRIGRPASSKTAWEQFIQWSIKSSPDSMDDHRVIRFDSDHLISRIFNNSSNRIVIALLDVPTQQYKYISPNTYDIIGFHYEQLIAGGVRFMFDQLHPDDIPGAIEFSGLINRYFKELPEDEKRSYCGQWDYRVRNSEGVYANYLQRDYVFSQTPDGAMLEYLVFFSRIENYKPPGSQHLRLTNGKTNLFYKCDHKQGKTYRLENLSPRELEVAGLISKSFSLKEIAAELDISFNTVKNHSNNILKKLEARDSMEAVSLMRVFGFI